MSFHFPPAHVHIKQIIEICTVFSLIILSHIVLSPCLPYSGTKPAWAQRALSADNATPVGKWFCSSEWNPKNFPMINLSFQGLWKSWSSTPEMISSVLAWVWFHSSSAPSTPRIQACPLPSQKKEKFRSLQFTILELNENFATDT